MLSYFRLTQYRWFYHQKSSMCSRWCSISRFNGRHHAMVAAITTTTSDATAAKPNYSLSNRDDYNSSIDRRTATEFNREGSSVNDSSNMNERHRHRHHTKSSMSNHNGKRTGTTASVSSMMSPAVSLHFSSGMGLREWRDMASQLLRDSPIRPYMLRHAVDALKRVNLNINSQRSASLLSKKHPISSLAIHFYRSCIDRSAPITAELVGELMMICALDHDINGVKLLQNEITAGHVGSTDPRSAAITSLHGLVLDNKIDECLELVSEMLVDRSKTRILDVDDVEMVGRALVGRGNFSAALHLQRIVVASGSQPLRSLYHVVMRGATLAGDIAAFEESLKALDASGVGRSGYSYKIMLEVCAEKEDSTTALELLSEMIQSSIPITRGHAVLLGEAISGTDNVTAVRILLAAHVRHRLSPSLDCFHHLLGVAANAADHSLLWEIVDTVRRHSSENFSFANDGILDEQSYVHILRCHVMSPPLLDDPVSLKEVWLTDLFATMTDLLVAHPFLSPSHMHFCALTMLPNHVPSTYFMKLLNSSRWRDFLCAPTFAIYQYSLLAQDHFDTSLLLLKCMLSRQEVFDNIDFSIYLRTLMNRTTAVDSSTGASTPVAALLEARRSAIDIVSLSCKAHSGPKATETILAALNGLGSSGDAVADTEFALDIFECGHKLNLNYDIFAHLAAVVRRSQLDKGHEHSLFSIKLSENRLRHVVTAISAQQRFEDVKSLLNALRSVGLPITSSIMYTLHNHLVSRFLMKQSAVRPKNVHPRDPLVRRMNLGCRDDITPSPLQEKDNAAVLIDILSLWRDVTHGSGGSDDGADILMDIADVWLSIDLAATCPSILAFLKLSPYSPATYRRLLPVAALITSHHRRGNSGARGWLRPRHRMLCPSKDIFRLWFQTFCECNGVYGQGLATIGGFGVLTETLSLLFDNYEFNEVAQAISKVLVYTKEISCTTGLRVLKGEEEIDDIRRFKNSKSWDILFAQLRCFIHDKDIHEQLFMYLDESTQIFWQDICKKEDATNAASNAISIHGHLLTTADLAEMPTQRPWWLSAVAAGELSAVAGIFRLMRNDAGYKEMGAASVYRHLREYLSVDGADLSHSMSDVMGFHDLITAAVTMNDIDLAVDIYVAMCRAMICDKDGIVTRLVLRGACGRRTCILNAFKRMAHEAVDGGTGLAQRPIYRIIADVLYLPHESARRKALYNFANSNNL